MGSESKINERAEVCRGQGSQAKEEEQASHGPDGNMLHGTVVGVERPLVPLLSEGEEGDEGEDQRHEESDEKLRIEK